MTPQIHKRALALSDLQESGAYLGRHSLALELRFYDAADETFRFIAENPRGGRRWNSESPRLHDVRVWRVKGFENWLVFYRPLPEGVEVLRVLHGARDLERWLEAAED